MGKTVLTFSGGGAKTYSYLGIWDSIVGNNIKVDAIVAASMGSLIGSLLAFGISTDTIKNEFQPFSQRMLWLLPKPSLRAFFSPYIVRKILNNLVGNRRIEEAKIPLKIITTNISSMKTAVISEGSLINAVLASCAYPGLYPPISINGDVHADGGILNNCPADIARLTAGNDGIVISAVCYGYFSNDKRDLRYFPQIIYRSIYGILEEGRQLKVRTSSDIIIDPFRGIPTKISTWLDTFKFCRLSLLNDCYKRGFEAAEEILKKGS